MSLERPHAWYDLILNCALFSGEVQARQPTGDKVGNGRRQSDQSYNLLFGRTHDADKLVWIKG